MAPTTPTTPRRGRATTRGRARTTTLAIALALVGALASARAGRAAFTADVCYGASWEPTATATRASIATTVKPVTAVPREHPLFVDAFAKACLDVADAAGNTSAATTVRLPKRTNAVNERYWSNAAGDVRDVADGERGTVVL